ncbi:type II restriction endonuclease [Streptococcus pneumoniae]|nr:type II restriction endonuclease [Streptococcus pneumoniae]
MTIDISEESLAKESADLLKILLKDRTTKKSIVWATHSYELLGKGFAPSDRINPSKVTGNFANLIQPRYLSELVLLIENCNGLVVRFQMKSHFINL